MTREEFKGAIASKFTQFNYIADAFYNAITQGQHIMLYGQGGHAKSEFAEYAVGLFYKPEDTFILSIDRHTPQAALTGPTDIVELMKGNFTLRVQQSIMAKKAAILEEGLDSRVISGLKDLLTRGMYCTGDVCHRMDTEFIVLCTNHTPEDWAQNASDMALLRRFHYRVKVEWKSYSENDFMKMFEKRFPEPEKVRPIAMLAELVHQQNPEYTPAAAIKDANAYLLYGAEGLIGSAMLKKQHIDFITTAEARSRAKGQYTELARRFMDVKSQFDGRNIASMTRCAKALQGILTESNSLRPDSELMPLVAQLRTNVTTLLRVAEQNKAELLKDGSNIQEIPAIEASPAV